MTKNSESLQKCGGGRLDTLAGRPPRAGDSSMRPVPQSVSFRRALFQVHQWIGVVAGLYILAIGLTGAALVFRIDFQRVTYPHLFTPSADGPLADPVTVMERVAAAYPDGRLSGIDAPTTARPTY